MDDRDGAMPCWVGPGGEGGRMRSWQVAQEECHDG